MSRDVYTQPQRQFELTLVPHCADELIRDRLATAVEAFNASTDAAERVDLFAEMTRLRRLLDPKGAVSLG